MRFGNSLSVVEPSNDGSSTHKNQELTEKYEDTGSIGGGMFKTGVYTCLIPHCDIISYPCVPCDCTGLRQYG